MKTTFAAIWLLLFFTAAISILVFAIIKNPQLRIASALVVFSYTLVCITFWSLNKIREHGRSVDSEE